MQHTTLPIKYCLSKHTYTAANNCQGNYCFCGTDPQWCFGFNEALTVAKSPTNATTESDSYHQAELFTLLVWELLEITAWLDESQSRLPHKMLLLVPKVFKVFLLEFPLETSSIPDMIILQTLKATLKCSFYGGPKLPKSEIDQL